MSGIPVIQNIPLFLHMKDLAFLQDDESLNIQDSAFFHVEGSADCKLAMCAMEFFPDGAGTLDKMFTHGSVALWA